MIQIVNRSGKLMRQINDNQKKALEEIGKFSVNMMDVYCPKDTLYLMSRNTYVINRNELFLMNDCHYAIHQEYGTYKMKEHPFMRPAARNHRKEISMIALKNLGRGI